MDGLQGLGLGSAIDPGVMPLIGVFYVCRHTVSLLGQLPRF
jgi:hypothetical protein